MSDLDFSCHLQAQPQNPFRKTVNSKLLFSQFGEDAYKSFLRVVGSDFVQDRNAKNVVSLMLSHKSEASEDCKTRAILALSQINQVNAFRLLYTLPQAVIEHASESITDAYIAADTRHWEGVAAWLLHWRDGGGRGKCLEVIKHFYSAYEQEATISEMRFRLIRKLVQDEKFFPDSFLKPACPWLLSEVAIARRRLEFINIPTTKEWHYKAVSKHLEHLSSTEFNALSFEGIQGDAFEDLPAGYGTALNNFLLHFDQVVELYAHRFAVCNPDFHRDYWVPYLSTSSRLNVSNRKNPKMQILGADKTQRRRSPKR